MNTHPSPSLMNSLLTLLRRARARRLARQQLRAMEARELLDLGIGPGEIDQLTAAQTPPRCAPAR
ncbi:DUF1127 domain-containing protein [Paucibacter soli]|uniref:DUF1127 domain-containing protein n=1 Tax=Paucibacter soli TaxID=3133433 RepID=UPI00309A41D3